jgi:hypothetical protein
MHNLAKIFGNWDGIDYTAMPPEVEFAARWVTTDLTNSDPTKMDEDLF